MTKRKIVSFNLIIELVFAVVFFAIYQISVLNNLDVFGDTSTGGGWLPYGFKVNMIFFGWAILSIVISLILWRIKKLNIKLNPLLPIAVLLPIITYNINHCFFINGKGIEYKEKQSIVLTLKKAEKALKNKENLTHKEYLEEYPVFIAEQKNESFYTYLYADKSFEKMYLFMKLSPESKAAGGSGALITKIDVQIFGKNLIEEIEVDYNNYREVSYNGSQVKEIQIFKNGIILKNTDASVSYFYCEEFKWLL